MISSGVIRLQKLSKGKHRQARELRKSMTTAETALWERLRKKSVGGVKFRRQQIIEGFIVDFFCETAKLVIEVDGEIHNGPGQKAIDAHRTEVFAARGLREVRFTNNEVLTDIEAVLIKIRACFQVIIRPLPQSEGVFYTPLSPRERGAGGERSGSFKIKKS